MKKVIAIVTCMVLILTACGGSADNNSSAGDGTTLRVVPYVAAESFDPYQSDVDYILSVQLFDYLFQRDGEGELQPCLAESWKDSEDSMSTTVKLRKDVTFSDGTPFNADAVVYNFNLGLQSYYQTGVQYFTACEKEDDNTVVFRKAAPYTDTAALLTDYMPIVSPAAYDADAEAFASSPVGTGAFTLESFDETTGYATLAAREDYFQGKPGVSKVIVQAPLESSVALVALENGETDLVEAPMSSSDLSIAADKGLIVESSTGWSMKTVFLFGEPFKSDQNLGLAVTYAINKEKAAKSCGDTEAAIATNLFAKPLMGDLDGAVPAYQYDPDTASEYLAKSNYNGETLYIDVTEEAADIATSIQADLKDVGINTEINQMDATTFGDNFEKGEIHMTILDSGVAAFGLADSIQVLTTGGFYEAEGLVTSTKEMDDAMDTVINTTDEGVRTDAMKTLLAALQEHAVIIPLYEPALSYVHSADLQGCEPNWGATTLMHLWKCHF